MSNVIHNQIFAIELLQFGKTIEYSEPGNSMTPIIESKEPVTLQPIKDISNLKKGDIVFCNVRGYRYTHKVYRVDKSKNRVLIGNNHGHINGWTRKVYGVVVAINGVPYKTRNRE